MRLVDRQLEKRALYLATQSSSASQYLLGNLNSHHFGNAALQMAFLRLKNQSQQGQNLAWADLVSDTTIDEKTRDVLKRYDSNEKSDLVNVKSCLRSLEQYRRARLLYDATKEAADAIQQDKIDVDKVANAMLEKLSNMNVKNQDAKVYNTGVKNSTGGLVKQLLYDKTVLPVIPTGFKTFDNINRGFFLGSLVIIAGTTGGGKTTLASQMRRNMTQFGANVCQVSLEMSEIEVLTRDLSAISGVSMQDMIKYADMDSTLKKKVIKAYKNRVSILKQRGSRDSIFSPTEDMTIEELMSTLKPYGFNVIIVDYITLLKGVDSDDQWRKLGSVARYCKLYAKNNHCLVILLAQINEEGIIRYSRAIQEHANNMWSFVRNSKSKETNTLQIVQNKARNQRDFPFFLKEDYDKMTIRDMTDDEMSALENYQAQSPDKKKGLPHQSKIGSAKTRTTISENDDFLEKKLSKQK